ncbi:hypothetical protein, partial [Micromonospora sp. NPDC005367]|uniref:hypothetical protein n=1 Tax=Micromonospora sp. NPDC005367 TaxID=3155590 RepID=UPI0033ABE334
MVSAASSRSAARPNGSLGAETRRSATRGPGLWRRGDADQGDYHEDVEALYRALLAAKAETGR